MDNMNPYVAVRGNMRIPRLLSSRDKLANVSIMYFMGEFPSL